MIILENDMNLYEQQIMQTNFAGTMALSKIRKNPNSVLVANEGNINYVAASDIETFMEANNMINPVSAIIEVARANNISVNSMIVVVDEGAIESNIEDLREAGIVLERAAEADATSLRKAMKWYDKFVSKSKGKADSKQELKNRISVLKKCKSDMESALQKSKAGDQMGKSTYTLKALIPFNSIVRLIKNDDVYAGMSSLAGNISMIAGIVVGTKVATKDYSKGRMIGGALGGVSGYMRGAIRQDNYEKMLERCIKNTTEAIDFLEGKLKDWND